MQISLKTCPDLAKIKTHCLVMPVGTKLTGQAKALDRACQGQLGAVMKRGDFDGSAGQSLMLHLTGNLQAERLLLLGTGANKPLEQRAYLKLLDTAVKALDSAKAKDAFFCFEELEVKGQDRAWQLKQLSKALVLGSYRYSKTLSKPKPKSTLGKCAVQGSNNSGDRKALQQGQAIAAGMNAARELGDLPGNYCTPSFLASQARALSRKHKALSVSVLDEKKMRELGMGALLSVTAGSEQPARLMVLEYKGAAKSQKPKVLVGKGITFDSGGISIKPGAKMDEMKYDMCGAASVLGTFTALLELQLPLNVVGIIAAAENLPSGKATKPGDVVTSMAGKTIEILNTDAEGRLVLCDALTYAERFKPDTVIDIATLTGACVVALGKHATGLYSNDDDLAEALVGAGISAGDRAWQMPLWEDYQNQLDSNFADMANVGGPEGGSITAACFLARFTEQYRWAHLDIAGTAWLSGAQKGATGRPVALLTQYLIDSAQ